MTTQKHKKAYITAAGGFLPGPPIDNDTIEEILGKVGGKESRLKKRILTQNGIKTRHYAMDREGRTTYLNEELAAHAITDALSRRGRPLSDVEMLACGTTQGDLPVPGFASMVHGRMGGGPMEVLSAGGVCCSGMAALAGVARAVALGERRVGVACGSELVSRMLKASRFEEEGTLEGNDEQGGRGTFRMFDADFLRWMLSDGAGAVVVEPRPAERGLSLRIEWIDLVSHAHANPTCMYTGLADKDEPKAGRSWLDQPTIAAADKTGMMKVRQDTRLLPRIVRLGVEEYLRHLRDGRLDVSQIDHVLCHYSSHFFKGEVMKLLAEAGVVVPEERWFTNLYTKGNTGAASIFLMLAEALNGGRFKRGEKIVLMVPESGRFSVAFALLTVVDGSDAQGGGDDVDEASDRAGAAAPLNTSLADKRWSTSPVVVRAPQDRSAAAVEAALARSPLGRDFADDADERTRRLVVELGLVWADFERMLDATPILTRLRDGTITLADYQRLLVNLRQQVMEGARWIARAASSLSIELFPLRSLFLTHASEEHRDFQILERDYVATGGDLRVIQSAEKNVGSEALSAYMFHRASQPDPLDLLGAMFIIEGLGTAKAHQWAEQLKETLRLDDSQVKFLGYHGGNDDRHFDKLRDVVRSGAVDDVVAARIVKTARTVARLYALQLEELDHV
ncbi:MAG: 3-oxoacyl-ACP synthase [Deltaproteobacteria bacterium]|nr:3-oxoacyl-ACP synthase [Deltaproteobacteria bacterium]